MGIPGKERVRKYREKQKLKGNKVLQVVIKKESIEILEALKKVLTKNKRYTNGDIIDFSLLLTEKALNECDNDFLVNVLSEFKQKY